MGRRKQERPTNANVATKVLAQAKAEKLWMELIDLERKRLGLATRDHKHRLVWKRSLNAFACAECGFQPDPDSTASVTPLANILRYLEDRAYGRPMDTVNHLHDKPLEVNATLTLGEGMRVAMQKAEERVRSRK